LKDIFTIARLQNREPLVGAHTPGVVGKRGFDPSADATQLPQIPW